MLKAFPEGYLPWVNWEAERFQLLLCTYTKLSVSSAPQRALPTSKPLRNVNTHCSSYPSFAGRETEADIAQAS